MSDSKQKRPGSPEIAAQLRQAIELGQLSPRERLAPERELADNYGVARGTIREALNRLSREGLVQIRPGSGTFVSDETSDPAVAVIANARPLELIDARFALEPHLCRLAVLHARRSDLDQMEGLLSTMENSVDDAAGYSQADESFHSLLAESTGNSLLIWISSQIASVRNRDQWARMRHLTLNVDTMLQYNQQHRAIVDAIRRRDPELAASLMKQHLETARLSLTRAVAT
jgi:GntR family uxuAB operon transcriptional repressor